MFQSYVPGMEGASSRPFRILVIEDAPGVQHMIVAYLKENNMCVAAISSRQEIERELIRSEPNLIILDLGRSQVEGIDRLREVRSRSNVPVIITGGDRCDETDRVIALELGAADYIAKPFGLRELLARIRAVLRRHLSWRIPSQKDEERDSCRFGGWRLDQRTRLLSDPNEVRVILTKGEYALLTAFLAAPQRPLTREYLLHATHMHDDIFDRSIDVRVMRLRRKLETHPNAQQVIQTERGVGYVFAVPVERFGPAQ